jgi:quercetin dioxygenase-like cupin family protein
MPIDFFNMLDEVAWKPLIFNQNDPLYLWGDGGLLADAPVDADATFEGAMWTGSVLMTQWHMRPRRARANFTVPKHHKSIRELIIVFDGECEISYEDESGKEVTEKVIPGGFFVSEAGAPHTMVAGPDGVIYTEQWDHLTPQHRVQTTWYDVGWVRR